MNFDLVTKLRLDGIRWGRSTATSPSRDSPAGSGRGFGAERNPARIVSFSDAVFAITVTLLVLEIRPPTDYTNLLHRLAALWPSYRRDGPDVQRRLAIRAPSPAAQRSP